MDKSMKSICDLIFSLSGSDADERRKFSCLLKCRCRHLTDFGLVLGSLRPLYST